MKKLTEDVSNAKSKSILLRNDIIFILCLLIVVSSLGIFFFLFRKEGNSVTVTVNGEFHSTYSLSEDTTAEIITGENGEGRNLLVIKDGKAYVESASCPDAICAAHKPIFRERESIVCLPNRVVITVDKISSSDEPDVIV